MNVIAAYKQGFCMSEGLRYLKDEVKTGTFHAMLKQLGINESDLHY